MPRPPLTTTRRLPRPPSPPSASGPPTRDVATPARRGRGGNGSLDLVLSDIRVRPRVARPGAPLVASPPAGLFIGGLPRELTADLIRHIIQTVGQQSPSKCADSQVRAATARSSWRTQPLLRRARCRTSGANSPNGCNTRRINAHCLLPAGLCAWKWHAGAPLPRANLRLPALEIGISVMLLRRLPQWRGRRLCAWMAPTLLL